jgi:hypothetical protein
MRAGAVYDAGAKSIQTELLDLNGFICDQSTTIPRHLYNLIKH